MDNTAASEEKFGFTNYVKILSDITRQPKQFYQDNPADKSWKTPLYVLMTSGLIYAIASVVASMSGAPVVMGMVFFANAVGMVFITSGIGYALSRLCMQTKVTFQRIFAIYAYASAAVLILSWMPYMIWITEPWRWWLIGCGLVKNVGFTVRGALIIIVLSIVIVLSSVQLILSL